MATATSFFVDAYKDMTKKTSLLCGFMEKSMLDSILLQVEERSVCGDAQIAKLL